MQRLILLRHGKAEQTSAGGDFERGLTERGRREAALTGRVLADAGYAPDLALVSTARRAMQTWQAVQPSFPSARVQASRELYHAEPGALAEAIAAADAAATLMIVGHNPGLHELALVLPAAAGTRPEAILAQSFPTAAAAVFAMRPDGVFTLEQFLAPRDTPRDLDGGTA